MKNLPEKESQIVIYQTESGQTKIEVRLQDESVWLTQQLMAELFQTTQHKYKPSYFKHLRRGRTGTRGNSQELLVSSRG